MISAWYGTLNTEDPANPFFKKYIDCVQQTGLCIMAGNRKSPISMNTDSEAASLLIYLLNKIAQN